MVDRRTIRSGVRPAWFNAAALTFALSLIACSGENGTGPPADVTAPADVTDLTVNDISPETAILSWTAPGDDGHDGRATTYQFRLSTVPFTGATWDTARVLPNPPVPRPAGDAETWRVTGLPEGVRYLAMRSADEVPNWSAVSNVVDATAPLDTLAPAQVSDLMVSVTADGDVQLNWSATGDDGLVGRAAGYDVRYATTEISEESWAGAVRARGEPTPVESGRAEQFEIGDLAPGFSYYFALRVFDEAGNLSRLSNAAFTDRLDLFLLLDHPGYGEAHTPDWSRDGRLIAFSYYNGYSTPIYIATLVSGFPSPLVSSLNTLHCPRWSLSGREILYIEESSQRSRILRKAISPDSIPFTVVSHDSSAIRCLAWSPDESQIAYLLGRPDLGPFSDLRIVPLGGGVSRLLEAGLVIDGLDWSPDGRSLLYARKEDGNWDLWIHPVDGGVPLQLTDDSAEDYSPSWSPDGSTIAFSSNRAGHLDIWTISSNGTDLVPVTSREMPDREPRWSPDGGKLCFTTGIEPNRELWVAYLEPFE